MKARSSFLMGIKKLSAGIVTSMSYGLSSPSTWLGLVFLLVFVSQGACSKDRHDEIPVFDTASWTIPYRGTLRIKSIDDGKGDILLMNIGSDARFALEKWGTIPAKDLANDRPIYRYIASNRKLVEIAPESWDATAGKLLPCSAQLPLLEDGTFTHDLITKLLQFNGQTVATAGPTVLRALPDPTRKYVAVLSTDGRFQKSSIPFGDPTVRGDRYHQLFRMSDASEVGKSVKLDVNTDRDYISPCWSPDGRFVVYHDASEHLWIIDVSVYQIPGTGGPSSALPKVGP